mgnify:CR=1 FL=1
MAFCSDTRRESSFTNIYSTVKNKTAHIEFTTTYNADLKEAISRTGQQLSYSYKNIDRVNYTLYSVTFTY